MANGRCIHYIHRMWPISSNNIKNFEWKKLSYCKISKRFQTTTSEVVMHEVNWKVNYSLWGCIFDHCSSISAGNRGKNGEKRLVCSCASKLEISLVHRWSWKRKDLAWENRYILPKFRGLFSMRGLCKVLWLIHLISILRGQ